MKQFSIHIILIVCILVFLDTIDAHGFLAASGITLCWFAIAMLSRYLFIITLRLVRSVAIWVRN